MSFYLGTAIKIIVILNIATASSAKITIEDTTGSEKVTDANMTKEADYVYTYIFQTDEDWDDGTYIATIKITSGSYTSITQKTFEMMEQD